VLFAKDITMEIACLDWLAAKANKPNHFQVYEIEDLYNLLARDAAELQVAYNKTGSALPCQPESTGDTQFKSFSSCFVNCGDPKPMKCSLHKKLESLYHCAIADARNCGATIRFLANEMGLIHIELEPNIVLNLANVNVYEQTESSYSDPDDPWKIVENPSCVFADSYLLNTSSYYEDGTQPNESTAESVNYYESETYKANMNLNW